jgi:hypothetical protein
MPSRHRDLGRKPLRLDQLANHRLGFEGEALVPRVEEQPWTVARDKNASAEPLSGLIVEAKRAQALAEGQSERVVMEVHLDSPFIGIARVPGLVSHRSLQLPLLG